MPVISWSKHLLQEDALLVAGKVYGFKKLWRTNGVSFRPGYRAAPLLTAGRLKQSVLKGVSSLFHITQVITNDVSLGNQ